MNVLGNQPIEWVMECQCSGTLNIGHTVGSGGGVIVDFRVFYNPGRYIMNPIGIIENQIIIAGRPLFCL